MALHILRNRDARERIATLTPFEGSNFRGVQVMHGIAVLDRDHRLPDDARLLFLSEEPIYVVYSWVTPIMWVNANGFPVLVDHHWSRSTGQHQHICRMAADDIRERLVAA